MFSLEDKVAVVTGGASGIGEATARRFAEAGAKVAIGDLSDASATAKAIGGLALRADVSREKAVEDLLDAALREFGRLDVVVNNAGVGAGGFLATLTERELDTVLAVNLKGTVWGIKHAAPRISDGGAGRSNTRASPAAAQTLGISLVFSASTSPSRSAQSRTKALRRIDAGGSPGAKKTNWNQR